MKLLLSVISFSVILCAQFAYADRIGNGGTYVVCNKFAPQSYFYDYYELTRIKNQKVIEPSTGGSPFAKAKAILYRQNENNKYFVLKLIEYIDQMEQNLDIGTDNLIPTNDNPNYTIEGRCQLIQAAVSGCSEGRWTYSILDAAWDNFDKINRTALVLHEVIYRLAFERGQTTSLNTKLLVQALLTTDENSDPNKIFNLRKQLDLVVEHE